MTVPVPDDFYEVVVKGFDGIIPGTNTAVDVHGVVLVGPGSEPFTKAYKLYKDTVRYALEDARVVLTEAFLKLHVNDGGIHFEVALLTDTGATPPPVEP